MAKTKIKKGYITLQDGRTMRVQKMSTPQYMVQHKWLYFLLLPGALYFILFRYVPMGGLVIAFKEYSPFLGMWESPWCGFDQFTKFFTGNDFSKLLVNTLGISLLQLVLYFPAPIILSLFLNEVRHSGYKRVVQTLVYIPHFVSWVIVASLTYQLFNVSDGIVNIIIKGITGSSWDVLSKSSTFWGLIVGQDIWRETGYGTIVFLAALAGVDQELYEAARVDGAGRWQCFWHITLPNLLPSLFTISALSILNSFKAFREAYLAAGDYPHESMYLLQHLFNNWYRDLSMDKMAAGATLHAGVIFLLVLFLKQKWDREE